MARKRWTPLLLGALLALAGAAGPVRAQSVTEVSGERIVLSAGSARGVRTGMTGILCGTERVGGEEVEFCPVTFRVREVRASSSVLEVTDGEAREVRVGFSARFDQPLRGSKTAVLVVRSNVTGDRVLLDGRALGPTPQRLELEPGAYTVRVEKLGLEPFSERVTLDAGAEHVVRAVLRERRLDPAAQLARADRLYDARDYEGAAAGYEAFARDNPGHESAEYARRMAAGAREKAQAARSEREAAARAAAAAARAEELAARAQRLLDAGQWQDAADLAAEALAADRSSAAARRVREEALAHLGPPAEVTDERSGVRFRLIPAGTFQMGCTRGDTECDSDERPAHRVTLSQPFYLAATETTKEQFERFVQATGYRSTAEKEGSSYVFNGSSWSERSGVTWRQSEGDRYPVVHVSWDDAVAFCRWLGGRLPSEAQWEVAARGGLEGARYPWGDRISHEEANYGKDECCGPLASGRDRWERTSPVGSFAPNGYGLFDMAGNVWEWVADWYDADAYDASPATDPAGPASGERRVLRGGSWISTPRNLRVSYRNWSQPDLRSGGNGFRCSRTVSNP